MDINFQCAWVNTVVYFKMTVTLNVRFSPAITGKLTSVFSCPASIPPPDNSTLPFLQRTRHSPALVYMGRLISPDGGIRQILAKNTAAPGQCDWSTVGR